MFSFFKPAPAIEKIDSAQVPQTYKRYRIQMMTSIFLGYATYYIVRKNFSLAKPYLISEMGLSTFDVGLIASGLSFAYGLSKFAMGILSDRSNPRYFLAAGLILSGLLNLIFPLFSSIPILFLFWFLNGWVQGMGWPPCGRTLTHWFSDKERGRMFAFWNVAHNIGGGVVAPLCSLGLSFFFTWKSMFYIPGVIALIVGILIIIFLRDTPQSVGLPPIEEFKNDYPNQLVDDKERELSTKEILFKFVFPNKNLWILAIANCFVYVIRYGVLDWAPTYLTLVKNYPSDLSRWQFLIYEYAGIPGTLLCGYLSDTFFKGRRAPISVIYMVLVTLAIFVYWLNPAGNYLIDTWALGSIGLLVYGPVMMIGVSAVDLVPKKAAGSAAGFTGLFGYLGGAVLAELLIGGLVKNYGWDFGFYLLIFSSILGTILLSLTWNTHYRQD